MKTGRIVSAALLAVVVTVSFATLSARQGASGTGLAADKTLDICSVSDTVGATLASSQ